MKFIYLAVLTLVLVGCTIRVFSDGNDDTERKYLTIEREK